MTAFTGLSNCWWFFRLYLKMLQLVYWLHRTVGERAVNFVNAPCQLPWGGVAQEMPFHFSTFQCMLKVLDHISGQVSQRSNTNTSTGSINACHCHPHSGVSDETSLNEFLNVSSFSNTQKRCPMPIYTERKKEAFDRNRFDSPKHIWLLCSPLNEAKISTET